jgi:hypothetical protein
MASIDSANGTHTHLTGAEAGRARRAGRLRRDLHAAACAPDGGGCGWLAGLPVAARELWHSLVSLVSSSGVPIEEIPHLVASTNVTEKVYRKKLRPVLSSRATANGCIVRCPSSWSVRLAQSSALAYGLVSVARGHWQADR